MFPQGSAVTVPRVYADIFVTEYGIARLKGKTIRRRIEELIAIAHPDFRAELRADARAAVRGWVARRRTAAPFVSSTPVTAQDADGDRAGIRLVTEGCGDAHRRGV